MSCAAFGTKWTKQQNRIEETRCLLFPLATKNHDSMSSVNVMSALLDIISELVIFFDPDGASHSTKVIRVKTKKKTFITTAKTANLSSTGLSCPIMTLCLAKSNVIS